jgi:hypothetical protein
MALISTLFYLMLGQEESVVGDGRAALIALMMM